MFFAYFFYLSYAVIPKCIAAPEFVTIPSGYELIQLHVIINSGSHSPKNTFLIREKRGFWRCDSQDSYSPRINVFPLDMPRSIHSIIDKRYSEYPPNCVLNDLTVEGMNQIHNLGLKYRNKLLAIDSKYFTEAKISQKFKVRSTYEDISFKNAVSFLTGLFNNEKIDDLEIITGTKSKEVIVANEKFCEDIKKLVSEYDDTDECKQVISQAKDDLAHVLAYLYPNKESVKNPTKSQIINACDFILSVYCNEQITDLNITSKLYEKAGKYYKKLNFDPFFLKSNVGIASATVIREITRTINNTIKNKSDIKFSLLSGDDSTIAAILSLMKKKNVFIPLASHISIALLKKGDVYYLHFAFNGNVLESSEFEKSIVSYDEFCKYLYNYSGFCHELP